VDLQVLFSGVAIGIIVGFMASYPVGFLREVGRHRAAKMMARREEKLRLGQVNVEARAAAAAREADEIAAQTQIERLRTERLGAMFVRRETRC